VSGHTPGPWSYALYEPGVKITTVAHCAGFVIGLPCSIPGGNYRDGDPSGDPEADARLIASAPDLLDQCIKALAAWEGSGPAIFLDDLRAAIAKATGEAA
jgi:hypothetical protein